MDWDRGLVFGALFELFQPLEWIVCTVRCSKARYEAYRWNAPGSRAPRRRFSPAKRRGDIYVSIEKTSIYAMGKSLDFVNVITLIEAFQF